MQSEPTTFEETIIVNHATLPSITFCVDTWENNFTTFQDIMDAIDLEKDTINTWSSVWGKNIENEYVDLKNASLVKQKFNSTLEDIWRYGATLYLESNFLICSSLNLDFIKLPSLGRIGVEVKTCLDRNFGLRYERHEAGQSLYNYQFDLNNGYQYYRQGINQFNLVVPIETKTLKQRTHDCFEDNSMKKTKCIDEYITEQLNCSLPWNKPHSNYGVCRGGENLMNFRAVHSKMNSKQGQLDLGEKGCLRPNCLQTRWKDTYTDWEKADPNCTKIRILLLSDSFTIQRKEILLADFSTFVVDCGSYLGLFLGASILSLTDSALAYILKAGATFFRK